MLPPSLRTCVLVLGVLICCPALARADSLPFTQTVQLGRPQRPVRVRVTQGENVAIEVAGRKHVLPARGATEASIESVPVSGGAAVALVRVQAADGDWVALLGGRNGQALLTSGKADWRGDPGERRRLHVEVGSVAGAGARSVRVGTRYEGLSLCSQRAALLDASSLDAASLELVPSHNPAPDLEPSELQVIDARVGTGGAAPLLRALGAAGSSRTDDATGLVLAPHALVDEQIESTWELRAGEFAVLRWTAPSVPIRQLELQASSSGTQAPALWVLADGKQGYRVQVPPEAWQAGMVQVTLPTPLTTRCVALLLDPSAGGQAQVTLRGVRAYTELDQPDGLGRLVSQLVQDDAAGATIADLLLAVGEPAALALAERYEELSPRGKRRAVRVLGRGLAHADVLARVVQAAHEEDGELSGQALAVLHAGGEPGREALRALVLEATQLGDTAAKTLAESAEEAQSLLQALTAEGGTERPALRTAIAQLARRHPDAFGAALASWLAEEPTASARAAAALAASAAGLGDTTLKIAAPLFGQELAFPERYRLAHALAKAAPSDDADAWLANQSVTASEWMMRRTAYDALRARNSERALSLADSLASDTYPRVRAAGMLALADSKEWARAAKMAEGDAWPLVREAAASALAQRVESQPALVRMLDDPSPRVRTAALESLTTQGARALWPQVQKHLLDTKEPTRVQAAAVSFAHHLCVQAAREALIETVRRGLKPEAPEEDVQLGFAALRALHHLGGDAAVEARKLATRESAPPGLAKAYEQWGAPTCEAPASNPANLQ